MFGTFRFFLGITVVIFHAGFSPDNIKIGVSAVVGFFILSGYAISGLYSQNYKTTRNAIYFYVERFIRIFPQYYFFLLIYFLMFYFLPLGKYLNHVDLFKAQTFVNNILLLPLGLTHYFPGISSRSLIGPATSLATEFLFYILVPIIFVNKYLKVIALLISLTVFVAATHSLISSVAYAYIYLPGPLVYFFLGHFLFKKNWKILALLFALLIVNHLVLMYSNLDRFGFNREIYIGIYFSLAAIFLLRRFKENQFSKFIGISAYGCFLGHGTILLTFRHYEILASSKPLFILSITALSVALGFISYYLIERPSLPLRQRWKLIKAE